MLTELYQYALDKGLAARPGFKKKSVYAYLILSAQGEFLGAIPQDKKAELVLAPDIGSKAQNGCYCNLLIEKAEILLRIEGNGKNSTLRKHNFYKSMLNAGAEFEPRFGIIVKALEDDKVREVMIEALKELKIKSTNAVGFIVDGSPMERSQLYLPWWEEFRKQFAPKQEGDLPRCLITGQLAPPLKTVPSVPGIITVVDKDEYAHRFLCFDKGAFQSYGLKQSANAPVSEEAMTAVNAALTQLITEAPVLGNAKIVHWYSCEIPSEEDPISLTLGAEIDIEESEDDGMAKNLAMGGVSQLLTSVPKGVRPEALNAKYYILPLSACKSRMMVRGWYEGSYENLHKNITQWFDDLSLVNWNGKGQTRPPKLITLCVRLLKPGGDPDPKEIFIRINKELPNLLGRLLYAIIQGTSLPDDIPPRVLTCIRSEMLRTDENTRIERRRASYGTSLYRRLPGRCLSLRPAAGRVLRHSAKRHAGCQCGSSGAVLHGSQRQPRLCDWKTGPAFPASSAQFRRWTSRLLSAEAVGDLCQNRRFQDSCYHDHGAADGICIGLLSAAGSPLWAVKR